MSLFSLFSRLGKKTVDHAVGLTSGSVPVRALDSSRAAFRLLTLIALVSVGFGSWLIYHSIYGATQPRIAKSPANANLSPSAEIEALKDKDTDGDTLSDYDELLSYHTSPYLSDSDGDTITDDKEIAAGSDPNCPQGKGCTSSGLSTTDSQSVALLRKALKSSGVSKTVLDQTDDATLLRLYQQTINGTINANSAAGPTNTSLSQPTSESLQNMSGADVRKLLLNNGIDASTLNKLDDATLQEIFKQAVDTSNTNS